MKRQLEDSPSEKSIKKPCLISFHRDNELECKVDDCFCLRHCFVVNPNLKRTPRFMFGDCVVEKLFYMQQVFGGLHNDFDGIIKNLFQSLFFYRSGLCRTCSMIKHSFQYAECFKYLPCSQHFTCTLCGKEKLVDTNSF